MLCWVSYAFAGNLSSIQFLSGLLKNPPRAACSRRVLQQPWGARTVLAASARGRARGKVGH